MLLVCKALASGNGGRTRHLCHPEHVAVSEISFVQGSSFEKAGT